MRFIYSILLLTICTLSSAKSYDVASPSGNNIITIDISSGIFWNVVHNGKEAISPSPISLSLSDGRILGLNPRVKSIKAGFSSNVRHSDFYRKHDIKEEYNSLTISFKDGFALEFRAFDSGVAYRFITSMKESFRVSDELVCFNFNDDFEAFIPYTCYPRRNDPFCVSFESFYDRNRLSEMVADSLAITPMLIDEGTCKVAVFDAGQEDYPGLFLKKNPDAHGVMGVFAPLPLTWSRHIDNYLPDKRADYIADCQGSRTFPWRVAVISDNDKELADNDLAWLLAPECRLDDTSWVIPGQSAWEWWNGMNLTGVGFKAGSNTETYKYYADFAADNGIEYMIVDGGWSAGTIMQAHAGLDIKELVEHAATKGVGVILWSNYPNMIDTYKEAIPYYAAMGVKGFKVDFFDRDDQVVMNDIKTLAEFAARYHILLDLHGMKAFGINRTYPNVLSFEGVRGLENYKWADCDDSGLSWDFAGYDVTIPFIRSLTGPMDYTPGAMDNAQKNKFRTIGSNPMSEGTRVHQMAMYTIYDAPLQMLADSPVKYRNNQECTDFIVKVPTVFDATTVLDGKVGEYIALARESDGVWYIGAMTNRSARDLTVDFSFLPEGEWTADIFSDGVNAMRNGTDYIHSTRTVRSGDRIDIHMATAGGWTAILTKKASSVQ